MKTTYTKTTKNNADQLRSGVTDAVNRAAREIAKAAEGYAKTAAPVDTGRLRSSITGTSEKNVVTVKTNGVEYAIYQELGTRRIPAIHYIRDSVSTHLPEYKAILQKNLKGSE